MDHSAGLTGKTSLEKKNIVSAKKQLLLRKSRKKAPLGRCRSDLLGDDWAVKLQKLMLPVHSIILTVYWLAGGWSIEILVMAYHILLQ